MRRFWILSLAALSVAILVGIVFAHGPGYGPWGGSMMGRGMMGYSPWGGSMMGRGMMGPAWTAGPCPWMTGYDYRSSARYSDWTWPINEKQAKKLVEDYIQDTGNPYLKAGKVKEKEGYFEVEVVTKKEGALVSRIAVDRDAGWMRPVE